MSINYAILGILSYKPITGYDLKKIIQDSPFMHWSGNNNQIYKALVELLDEGFVTNEVRHQESAPSKKVYSITPEGLSELKEWVLTRPELPEFKKQFLVQLAWGDCLGEEELNGLLIRYEAEIELQLLMQQEKQRRGAFSPDRTSRESLIWEGIYNNIISSLECELNWVKNLRNDLYGHMEKEEQAMNYNIVEKNNIKYLAYMSPENPIESGQDALDLIAACGENNTRLLMLYADTLTEDFFKLRTGLAGEILQKFINYRVKVAVVLPDPQKAKGKFKELLAEANRGNDFRTFESAEKAEEWLTNK